MSSLRNNVMSVPIFWPTACHEYVDSTPGMGLVCVVGVIASTMLNFGPPFPKPALRPISDRAPP
jgi:hypothetical protein